MSAGTTTEIKCHITDGIFIRSKDGYYTKYLFDDILWLEASGNYCYIYIAGVVTVLIVQRLCEVEKWLPADRFLRIHRSYIVNMYAVTGFVGNLLCLGSRKLPVSEPYREAVARGLIILDAQQVRFGYRRKKRGV